MESRTEVDPLGFRFLVLLGLHQIHKLACHLQQSHQDHGFGHVPDLRNSEEVPRRAAGDHRDQAIGAIEGFQDHISIIPASSQDCKSVHSQ